MIEIPAGETVTPGALGRKLGLESASVTALLDRLERADLVVRLRDEQDRRRVIVEVTAAARELGWSFFGPLIGHAVDHTADLSDAEIATIDGFLTSMASAVDAARAAQ